MSNVSILSCFYGDSFALEHHLFGTHKKGANSPLQLNFNQGKASEIVLCA